MDDLDRCVEAMVGAHPFVIAAQIERHLGLEGAECELRLAGLRERGFLRRDYLSRSSSPIFCVTRAGLEEIGSRLPVPSLVLSDVRHQLAMNWMWVAAWEGAFGEMARVLSRREQEALDRAAASNAAPGSGFVIDHAGERRYPDLAMVTEAGHRIAVHAVLWPHRSADTGRLLGSYRGQSPPADAVLVLVDTKAAQGKVKADAARLEVGDRVHVRLALTGASGAEMG